MGSVLRGLVLAIPLVMIFAGLFSSADPIFRRGMDDLLGFRIDLGDLPGRLIWDIGRVAGRRSARDLDARDPGDGGRLLGAASQSATVRIARSLGTTEALVVLVAVDLIVGLFVALQLAYLFGGLDTLAAAGMTYSSYARRGTSSSSRRPPFPAGSSSSSSTRCSSGPGHTWRWRSGLSG